MYNGGNADAQSRLEDVYNILDKTIDGSDGTAAGTVRWKESGSIYDRLLFKTSIMRVK